MRETIPPPSESTYDLIGDIHGYEEPLRNLLAKLGYQDNGTTYCHPEGRQVIFLGDFIDRGPKIRETLHLVKAMVDAGHALAVMGNHEYNAVCFQTPDGNGDFLRSRIEDGGKNVVQHQATLDAFVGYEEEWNDWIKWFKKLPFSLDLGGLRAVHATWCPSTLEFLANKSLEDPDFLNESAQKGSSEFTAVETVLKGINLPLPAGHAYTDKQGIQRPNIRVRWWEQPYGKSYREVVYPDCESVPEIPVKLGPSNAWEGYPTNDPPVFFGHYWVPSSSKIGPVSTNAACLDFSVSEANGKLVAYRWDGEAELNPKKFIPVSTNEMKIA
ncbi:metallophosphoesterase [Akkermansiaceae bacterium]|nr:metallophosphoesterase [Akkermansiaceae bacterium]